MDNVYAFLAYKRPAGLLINDRKQSRHFTDLQPAHSHPPALSMSATAPSKIPMISEGLQTTLYQRLRSSHFFYQYIVMTSPSNFISLGKDPFTFTYLCQKNEWEEGKNSKKCFTSFTSFMAAALDVIYILIVPWPHLFALPSRARESAFIYCSCLACAPHKHIRHADIPPPQYNTTSGNQSE